MAVPADFTINFILNPSAEVDGAHWTGTNTAPASSTAQASNRTHCFSMTAAATAAMSIATATGTSAMAISPSTSYALQGQARAAATSRTVTASITWYTSAGAVISTSTGTGVANTTTGWTTVSVVATSPSNAAYASASFSWGTVAASEVQYLDAIMLKASSTVDPYLDGASGPDNQYEYVWSGTADESTTLARYRGVWVELISGSGAPGVQVYANGTGLTSNNVTITRTADGETWTVPGWNERSIVDGDTLPDYAVPLGRQVTYTCFINDSQINSMNITVNSTTGWVQDPWDASTAMPVEVQNVTTAHLSLAEEALASRTHLTNATRGQMMGSSRQYSLSGQRTMDEGCKFSLYAHQNDVSDAFKALVRTTPILLFRPLPSWGSVPGLSYTDGPAVETMVNRQRISGNVATTKWDVEGPLIQPVSRVPLVQTATNNQMLTNLSGTTYDTIKARSGSKRYIDIKANPLGL